MKKDWQQATEAGDCARVASLINNGENIDSLDRYGQTALMNAVYRGDTELVKLLVASGANLDITAKYNLTALMLAVINDHNDIVSILVNNGANTQIKGNRGTFLCTPLEYARKYGKEEIVSIINNCN